MLLFVHNCVRWTRNGKTGLRRGGSTERTLLSLRVTNREQHCGHAWGDERGVRPELCHDEIDYDINDDFSTGHVIGGGPPLVGGSERQFLPRPTPGAWEDRS